MMAKANVVAVQQDTKRTAQTMVVVGNTVLCAGLFLVAFGVQLATVMTGAAAGGLLGNLVGYMGLYLPLVPVASVVGSWVAYALKSQPGVTGFVALPWAYTLVMASCLGMLFLGA